MSCEYSIPYPGVQSALSANGAFVTAVTAGNRLSVRSCQSLEVTNLFQCVDKIDKVEISPDNCFILCALYSRNVIQVFSIEDKDWKCRINEGVAGMTNVYWTPDSRNVVVESDFGIQVSLWSLTDSHSVIISLPKPVYSIYSKTSAFSECHRFYALVHRIDLQDQIGVYSVSSQTSLGMSEISKFRARSNDVASVYWVPGGTHIVTLDSPLTYKFCAYTPLGECLATFEAYQNALGIRCIALSKAPPMHLFSSTNSTISSTGTTNNTNSSNNNTGTITTNTNNTNTNTTTYTSTTTIENKFIALGSFDSKVRLLSVHSWQVAFALPLLHPRELDAGFNAYTLLLTVEVSTRTHTDDDIYNTTIDTNTTNTTTDTTQHQVPPIKQILRTVHYIPNNLHTMYDRDGNVIPTVRTPTVHPVRTAGTENVRTIAQESDEHTIHTTESYFVLKHTKTLPRTQPFVLEGKRTTSSGVGGSSTTSGTSVGVRRGSSTTSGTSVGHTSSSHSSGFPAVGVSWVGWSSSTHLLAAREEAHSRCIWVWRPLQAQLVAVLVLLEPVLCARWRPLPTVSSVSGGGNDGGVLSVPVTTSTSGSGSSKSSPSNKHPPTPPTTHTNTINTNNTTTTSVHPGEDREVLAFCTGTSRVYFWSEHSGVTFSDMATLTTDAEDSTNTNTTTSTTTNTHTNTPHTNNTTSNNTSFAVTSLLWAKDGMSLILRGKEAHCVCRVSLPVPLHH